MVRRVVSRDGTSLAVAESGDPAAPTVVCVHGYPDNRTVWNGVAEALADRYHVVTYDVRGAGDSDKPRARSAYHLDRLAEDLAAVIDAVSLDRPVHLLAHDWGSIQTWHAITGPDLRGRVSSYTSISGPCLDHAGHWLRSRLRPSPRALRELVTQLVFSGYIGFFQLPLIPELAWRTGLTQRVLGALERPEQSGQDSGTSAPALPDALHGLALYRENMIPRFTRPESRYTDVPVQVLAPTGDPFVSTPVQTDISRWVPDLRIRRLPGGHWLPRSRPEVVARCASELVEHIEGGPQTRQLRRSRVPTGRRSAERPRTDQLVVVSGAGSGIGRATALAFAEEGADVVVTDIDETSVRRTAELAELLGVRAEWSLVDVSDGPAMADFAKRVRAEHGVPDVVVNNAGIGIAGPFAKTTAAEWERVIDVNLWGVIHGCRVFSEQMIEQGEGGRIVNVASAAAYLPSKALSAYATSKSAVLTLSQCLRAELAAAGIGVVTVCPGFVHTNITSTTRFVGVNTQEQERRRSAATRAYRRRGFTPDRAAGEILRAVAENKAIAPVTAEARTGLVLSRLTPGLLRTAARLDLTPN